MKYSETLMEKVRLYYAANYLYSRALSHPQVVKVLSEFNSNIDLVTEIADQAMTDKWRKVLNKVQELTSQGVFYSEIVGRVEGMIDDPELIHFITNSWYAVETLYMENFIESKSNLLDGRKILIISTVGLVAVVYFNASIFTIFIWSLGVIVGLSVWLQGRYQRRLSVQVEKILKKDYWKFEELI